MSELTLFKEKLSELIKTNNQYFEDDDTWNYYKIDAWNELKAILKK